MFFKVPFHRIDNDPKWGKRRENRSIPDFVFCFVLFV